MATELGSLYYDLNIDDKKLKGQLDRADSSVKNFGDRLNEHWDKSVAASKQFAVGVAAAGAAVVGFGVTAVKAFQDSELGIAQTNAVLKSTGQVAGVTADAVTKLATALERQTKFSDDDVRSVENLLLTFTSIGKDIFPQATKTVLDMATALGEDTKSASIQLGKALQDPIQGVTALRRVGVNFNQSQQDVIKNLVETGRTAEAQKLILAELRTEFGGSAEAAGGTFSGALAKLKNQFNNLQEAIGGTIVKAIQPFIEKMLAWYDRMGGAEGVLAKMRMGFEKLKPWFPAIIGLIIGGLTPALVSLAAAGLANLFWLSPFLIAGATLGYLWKHNRALFWALATVVGTLATAFMVLKAAMSIQALIGGVSAAASVAGTAFGGLGASMASALIPLAPWILGIGAVAVGVGFLIKHFVDAKNAHKSFIDDVADATSTSLTPFSDAISTVSDKTQNMTIQLQNATNAGTTFTQLFTVAQTNAQNDLNLTQEKFNELQAQTPALLQQRSAAQQIVNQDQAEYNQAVLDYGPYSDQATAAADRLSNAQTILEQTLRDNIGHVLNLEVAKGNLAGANDRLIETTQNLKTWQDILKDGIFGTVNAIAQFGPTASAQIPSFMRLHDSIKSVTNLSGDLGQLQNSVNNMAGVLQSSTNTASKLQSTVSSIKLQAGSVGTSLQGTSVQIQGSRASGGPVSAFSNYLVGETGRELFVPSRNGVIFPHKLTEMLMGNMKTQGGNTVVNIGEINNDQDEAYVLRRLDRNTTLEGLGLSPM